MNVIRKAIDSVRKFFGLKENLSANDIYGTPVDFDRLYPERFRGAFPVYGPEVFPEKNTTLRTLQDHNRARNVARALAEGNPNAAGTLERLIDYVVSRGSTTELHGIDGDPPARLTKDVKKVNDGFKTVNDWCGIESEIVARLITDGEFFLRFFPDEDGSTKVRFVEPSQVQPPMGEDANGPWSLGVYTPYDATMPEAYCVHDWQTGTDEIVEAQFIIHGKASTFRNQKRGVPMLWSCECELRGAERLRYVAREGEKARQAVSYFRQHDNASKQVIEDLRADNFTDVVTRTNSDGSSRTVYVERQEPGSVIDIPKGLVPVPPPMSPNAQAAEAGVMMALESVAARFGVPAWIVTGKTDGANFAAALTAESPLTKSLERWHGKLSAWSDQAQTKAVEIAVEQDVLPEDTLERIDLLVTFPSSVTRNKKEETDRRKTLHDDGVISKSTWRSEEGYDEKEAEKIIEERQEGATPGTAAEPTPSGTPAARYAQLAPRPE